MGKLNKPHILFPYYGGIAPLISWGLPSHVSLDLRP